MPEPWRGSLDEPPEGNKLYITFNCLLSWSFFNLQIGKTRVASLYLICSELEFDGYVFDRIAMLACDLAASLNHHFKKARFFCTDKSKLTSLSMSFPALFKIWHFLWTGLDLAFTSIESLNFPETSPQLLELSLRLANAPAFSNPLNLLKLGKKLTHWLIGPIDSLAGFGDIVGWCLLTFAVSCCAWVLSF